MSTMVVSTFLVTAILSIMYFKYLYVCTCLVRCLCQFFLRLLLIYRHHFIIIIAYIMLYLCNETMYTVERCTVECMYRVCLCLLCYVVSVSVSCAVMCHLHSSLSPQIKCTVLYLFRPSTESGKKKMFAAVMGSFSVFGSINSAYTCSQLWAGSCLMVIRSFQCASSQTTSTMAPRSTRPSRFFLCTLKNVGRRAYKAVVSILPW